MYVIEPGGNRIELFGDSGYLIFDPDWKTIEWRCKRYRSGYSMAWYVIASRVLHIWNSGKKQRASEKLTLSR